MNNNSSITDFVRDAQQWTQSFSQAFDTVSQDTYKKMQDLSATVKQGYDLLKQDFAAFKNSKLGTILSGIGSTLVGAAGAAGTFLLDLTKKALSSAITGAIQKEKDIVNLSGFLGKKGATEAYKNIDADSNATSYDKSTLLDANKGLISVDGDAKKAREEIMNLANAVSFAGGGNDELSKLSEQLKEIKSEGVASGDQLKQFGDSGIDIYAALSSSTGKSIEQLKSMNITYDMLAKSLADSRGKGGIFEGGLEAQSNTVEAKWDRIKKTFDSTLTELGTAFLPIISSALDVGVQLMKGFEPLMTLVKPYLDEIVGSLGSALDFILNLGGETNVWGGFVTTIQEYFSIVWSTLGSVFSAVWSIVSGIIDWASKSMLISDIFTGVYKILGAVLTVVGWLADGVKGVWDNVLRPILDKIETAYRWIRKIVAGEEVAIEPKVKITPPKDLAKDFKAQELGFNFKPTGTDLTSRTKPTAINQGDTLRRSNVAKSKDTGDTVSGGGQKTINITLGKFFDTIQFNTLNSGETSDQLESIVMECLGRVLYNGAKVM
ncbi:hypothetical protein C1637_18555 [Chryseobacterium lactis]|uniref:Tape measure protein N-terminal domain-containing protein n=1 Tax=Chryseobacterium lactis TaxID=1241981 RepID=A0A3G6RMQ8_CHRLC|nr:tape measure protein [Chryseobacterium lactis]AZA84784.1 hypothetical protein EG342_24065 [Chryseobacterium lactis]AZB05173.1 hypothetical protein EG341_14945 [Chryseobacterium lactis]PNW12155.1 hypothetical protein C1637_18555 [Chryseobacterium lactis]